jgi:hypothetical protein
MNLKQLINKSYYGSIGYIENNTSIDLLGSYLLYNKIVLDEYKGHIFAFTHNELDWSYLKETILQLYPNAIILLLNKNRGHNFGTADLDNFIFNYCKDNNIEWLCKSANDVILTEDILSVETDEADFYYLNGISFEDLYNFKFNYEELLNKHFYPQTNLYFINVSKTDYLNNKEYIDSTYTQSLEISNYNGKIWEYISGWSCENFLKQSVIRNCLSKSYLLDYNTHTKLCETIKLYKIGDPSHKNIMINGICHYQYNDKQIIII